MQIDSTAQFARRSIPGMHLPDSRNVRLLALGVIVPGTLLLAAPVRGQRIESVFVIDLENHNWTQDNSSGPEPIYGNPAAPFINSLVTPGDPNSAKVSYASAYHNVLATPAG